MIIRYSIMKLFTNNLRRHLLACLVMGLVVIIALPAQAQNDFDQPVKGTRWALLIGIADYPSSEGFQVQQLKAPVKDVKAMAAFLGDPEKGGFDSEHIFTLTDAEATRRKILITFNDIAKRAAPEDMVIFYFSGHGVRLSDSESTYLIPYDHDLSDVGTTCIDFDDLAEKIRNMAASKVIVILDACNSGGVKPVGARTVGNTGIATRYMEAFKTSEGRALLLSSDQTEVSWETEESGVFTRFLLEGLNGAADANDDGIVTFIETAIYVEEAVPKYTREHFPRVQTPARRYELGQVRGYIPLAINPRKASIHKQATLLNERNMAIFEASLAELDDALKDFSLQVAKSAHDKTINDEPLTQQEKLLLKEIDALKKRNITAADYVARARAIYNLDRSELRISVKPADAVATLTPVNAPERVIRSLAPNAYKVDPGLYSLSVKRTGYKAYSRQITVKRGGGLVTVELESLKGTLRLRVSPANAEVTVTPISVPVPNAEMSGSRSVRIRPTSEDSLKTLPVGTYSVTARKEGYEHATQEFVEIKADVPTTVNLTLMLIAPELARIVSAGLPAGTRVLVDGISVSLPYETPPGAHRIRLERNGYHAVDMHKNLRGDQVLPLNPTWTPLTGTLQLNATPYDAIVTITPISIVAPDTGIKEGVAFRAQALGRRELPAGTYRVNAIKDGYESVVKEPVQIRAKEVAELAFTLRRLTPAIDIITPSEPTGFERSKGVSQLGSFAALVVIPGLGQHLQGRHASGVFYEVTAIGAGVGAVLAYINYDKALDDYEDIKARLSYEASRQSNFTFELQDLEDEQIDAYDKAKSSRTLAIAAQIAVGVIWGINALDAGLMAPAYPNSGFAFEARPTLEGAQVMVRASF